MRDRAAAPGIVATLKPTGSMQPPHSSWPLPQCYAYLPEGQSPDQPSLQPSQDQPGLRPLDQLPPPGPGPSSLLKGQFLILESCEDSQPNQPRRTHGDIQPSPPSSCSSWLLNDLGFSGRRSNGGSERTTSIPRGWPARGLRNLSPWTTYLTQIQHVQSCS